MESMNLNPAVFNAIDTMMPLSFEPKNVAQGESDVSFIDMLHGAMGHVVEARDTKLKLVEEMIGGKDVDTHSVMIAQAKEDIVTRFASTSVTKVASAYQTIMNMQI